MRTCLRLEQELESELDLPVSASGRGDPAETSRGISAGVGEDGGPRVAEIGPIQDVEELGSELDAGVFGHGHILQQGEVEVDLARAGAGNPAQIAQDARRMQGKGVAAPVFVGVPSIR